MRTVGDVGGENVRESGLMAEDVGEENVREWGERWEMWEERI